MLRSEIELERILVKQSVVSSHSIFCELPVLLQAANISSHVFLGLHPIFRSIFHPHLIELQKQFLNHFCNYKCPLVMLNIRFS